ncbi:hypothetical protein GQ55_4G361000 [Panicum hallii var. hallii]|uniref:KIB1-4 beta-propeller domain-containing protein n=1 Tax=Panicum hallii var. hallii TaxID=1504633 RepID=A0A2T7E3S2_9POAL|nr:hypothetical protein GQ55_4G361000 [Panicum hallii var. hallii]
MEAKPSLCKLLPPLMIRSCAQLSNDAHSGVHHAWQLQLMDPANPSLRFHRPVPATIPPGMEFVGCSYGHAIFADLLVSETGGNITMIDVFTGVQVSSPPCPELAKAAAYRFDYIVHSSNIIAKACLLVSTRNIVGQLLVWRIGRDDWQHATTDPGGLGPIDQIVAFQDKIIALDWDLSLYTVHLDDAELGMSIRPLLIVEENDGGMVNNDELLNPQLVRGGVWRQARLGCLVDF